MDHSHDVRTAWLKMAVTWVLTLVGNVTLQDVATMVAIVYTVTNLYVLVRDRIVRKASG